MRVNIDFNMFYIKYKTVILRKLSIYIILCKKYDMVVDDYIIT